MAHEILKNENGTTDILVYDEIGADDWGGISSKDFAKDLASLGSEPLNIRINSPGGSVFDGVAMYQALKSYPGPTTATVEGIAASIASVIMLGADKVVASETSMVMIHSPWMVTFGNATELRQAADTLEKVGESILAAYALKTGGDVVELQGLLEAETWLTADEALELGLIDEITGEPAESAVKNIKEDAGKIAAKIQRREINNLKLKIAKKKLGLRADKRLN